MMASKAGPRTVTETYTCFKTRCHGKGEVLGGPLPYTTAKEDKRTHLLGNFGDISRPSLAPLLAVRGKNNHISLAYSRLDANLYVEQQDRVAWQKKNYVNRTTAAETERCGGGGAANAGLDFDDVLQSPGEPVAAQLGGDIYGPATCGVGGGVKPMAGGTRNDSTGRARAGGGMLKRVGSAEGPQMGRAAWEEQVKGMPDPGKATERGHRQSKGERSPRIAFGCASKRDTRRQLLLDVSGINGHPGLRGIRWTPASSEARLRARDALWNVLREWWSGGVEKDAPKERVNAPLGGMPTQRTNGFGAEMNAEGPGGTGMEGRGKRRDRNARMVEGRRNDADAAAGGANRQRGGGSWCGVAAVSAV
ncbi:hypothetical protein DFH09DRAFT_1285994 [Mycena vulgaris]|nr:hypothetical protein DFH09DRAFT_1285994 [Mycena vulgaris]